MFLREYHDVVCLPRQVVVGAAVVLPESFTTVEEHRQRNVALDKLNPDFARSPPAGLTRCRCPAAGSTSTTTWAGTSAMPSPSRCRTCGAGSGRTPPTRRSARWSSPTPASSRPGSATCSPPAASRPTRCTSPRAPVRVERLVGCTPMFSRPAYVHPAMLETYDAVSAALSARAGEGPRPRRSSSAAAAPSGPASTPPSSWPSSPRPGSRSVYPEDHPLADQVELVRRAEVLAGYAGSAMFHVALAGAPKHVVLVTSESYPAHNEYLMSVLLGHRLDVVVCEPLVPRVDGQFTRESFHSDFAYRPEREGVFLRAVLAELPSRTRVPAGADHPPRGTAQVRHDVAPGGLERGVRRPSRRLVPAPRGRPAARPSRPGPAAAHRVHRGSGRRPGRGRRRVVAARDSRGSRSTTSSRPRRERGVGDAPDLQRGPRPRRQPDREALDEVLGGEDVTLVADRHPAGAPLVLGLADAGQARPRAVPARRRSRTSSTSPAATRPAGRAARPGPGESARRPPGAELAARARPGRGPRRSARPPRPRAAAGQPLRNTSLGTDTEVVLRINRADLALGTSEAGKRLLAELRGDGFSYRDDAGLADRYALTDAHRRGCRRRGGLAGRTRARRRGARPARAAHRLGRPDRAGVVRRDQPPRGRGARPGATTRTARRSCGGPVRSGRPTSAACSARRDARDRPPAGDGRRQRHAGLVQRRRAVRRRGERDRARPAAAGRRRRHPRRRRRVHPARARPGRWSRRSWTGWSR